jgi:hypothetical protein
MPQEKNWFVRSLILVFTALLAAMVAVSFALGRERYAVNSGMVTVLLLITVLILSEGFNNLSIGKLLTLSREIEKEKGEKQALKQENVQLREHFIQVTSTVNKQSQVNATFQGVTPEYLRMMLGVTAAPPERKEEQEAEIQSPQETESSSVASPPIAQPSVGEIAPAVSRAPLYRMTRGVEEYALTQYVAKHQLPVNALTREVQFTPLFQGVDPIMERKMVFDAYLKDGNSERFFEILSRGSINPMRWDRLYVLLSKLWYYRQAKNVQADLTLLVLELPDVSSSPFRRPDFYARFLEAFQPAIANGLLRVESVQVSAREYDEIEEGYRRQSGVGRADPTEGQSATTDATLPSAT